MIGGRASMKEEFSIYKERTEEAKKLFSPSFCFAKWYHSNIYFQTGETHSCYHPAPHPIDVKSIKKNPATLHNTDEKLKERHQMLNGVRPKGCQYCWNIEDLEKDLISDRHIRTGSLYSAERIAELKKAPLDPNLVPDYIEISFSNKCNFKCGYCHPKASSRFYKEIEEFGPYTTSKNHRCDIDWFKIYHEEDNPYLEAWWKWWPALSKKLAILRLTGGEPLLQNSTYKLINYISEFPNPNLEFNVNSNMGSANSIIAKFCDSINALIENQKIKKFKLFTSLDTWGPQAEYIRTGLDLLVFENNIEYFLKNTTQPLTLMVTFNIFSIPNFTFLLKKILEWRTKYSGAGTDYQDFHRIRFDISYLKEPLQYDINILPKDVFLPMLESSLDFMKSEIDDQRKDKFTFIEYQKLLRTYEYMKNTVYDNAKIKEGRSDFFNFFTEYDKRRKTDLLHAFPELIDFWELCKGARA